ncbi:hypothetical protein RJ639_018756 [Escallonia herrerae]|uniref:Phosphoglucan phosphatase LSF2, chloroplastic n=1 Tax=Escallonia herrerae TaxID=1293975 RepID=A0AA88VB19_9ASTE|nr:hypothetical protein RJ639_018756 [Escallonia herrerae]
MEVVGNTCFSSSSVLVSPLKNGAFPLSSKAIYEKRSCNFTMFSRGIKLNKISCKSSESGIQENPKSKSGSGTKMEEYNTAMKRMMRNPYEYHHDLDAFNHVCFAFHYPADCSLSNFPLGRNLDLGLSPVLLAFGKVTSHGMNYTLILDNLIVGSQPQKAEDIDHLKEEVNVAYILNLQQDGDIEYWGVDLKSIIERCQRRQIRHMRRPARDFDPDSLRSGLPKAVSSVEWAILEGKGRVYIHCTAGLGRAPAVAIAYMFWFCDMDLNTAYNTLTLKRPCGPNRKAIRGATYDLAKNDPWKEPLENLPEHAFEDIADWERKLIQDRVRSLRGT